MNLVAALFALVIIQWAGRPHDEDHPYGHEKARRPGRFVLSRQARCQLKASLVTSPG